MKYHTNFYASWKTCVQIKNQHLGPDTEQWTGTKLGREYVKAVYFHSPYLIYMQGSVQFCFIVYTKALTMFVGSQQIVKTSDQLGSVAQSYMTLQPLWIAAHQDSRTITNT